MLLVRTAFLGSNTLPMLPVQLAFYAPACHGISVDVFATPLPSFCLVAGPFPAAERGQRV